MGMFDSYNNNETTNLNTSFTPNPYAPQYPPLKRPQQIVSNNPNKPYEVVDVRGNLIGYFWYYGNSVDLIWDIIGESTFEDSNNYLDVVDTLKHYNIITATIYDWRHLIIELVRLIPLIIEEKIPIILPNGENHIVDKSYITVTLPIKGELSQKMVKGTYTISLTASNTQGYNETLFDTGVCTFEVR